MPELPESAVILELFPYGRKGSVASESPRDDVVQLSRGGTGLLLRLSPEDLPVVLHWGPALDLGDDASMARAVLASLAPPVTDSVVSSQERISILPRHGAGWLGRPGLLGSRAGRAWSIHLYAVEHRIDEAGDATWPDGPFGAVRVVSTAADAAAGLTLTTELELLNSGVVRVRAIVCNLAAEPYEVAGLLPALAVPGTAVELLDVTGRHVHERHPQRRPFDIGAWVREAWGGRPGHDSPTVLVAGTAGFGSRTGRVWGVHCAWSGNQTMTAERTTTDWRLLRGGENLLPGEVRLEQGESYSSPWLIGSWGEGLDELAGRIHRMLRARPQHPTRARPVLLNTWEAVYFDHDLDRLVELARAAAAVGVERFVLDDGWFTGRRDDHAGLGDWTPDAQRWPDGLTPLVDEVHRLGMEFGLWVEPEMVNLDSDLARAHPEWLFATDRGPGVPSRQQHVLDLGHPEAYAHVLDRISAVVAEYQVAYLKWDHNRPLVDAGHTPGGEPGVRRQTLAVYRLMADLKERHPGLEIESCAGGGARIDLGVLDVTDRVWPSDCIDAHERHRIIRWTGLLLPPELMGAHIGSAVDHSTGRALGLSFRAGTALWGHLGIEADLTRLSDDDLDRVRAWVAFHKRMRPLLHHGDVVHADLTNPALWLEGVVSTDRTEALYRLSVLDHSLAWPMGRVRLPGLAAHCRYRVTLVRPDEDATGDGPARDERTVPPWALGGVEATGSFLAEVGLQAPLMGVDTLELLHVQAV